jgi:dethiobiotin synthetase
MGIDLTKEDKKFLTCPYNFKFPASPHLAAKLEKKSINLKHLDKYFSLLQKNYDIVLIEGVGGLCVPLKQNFTTLDYLIQKKYPTYVVTVPRLGSINHTILTLDTLINHKIPIAGIIYNVVGDEKTEIVEDTKKFLKSRYKNIQFAVFPKINI